VAQLTIPLHVHDIRSITAIQPASKIIQTAVSALDRIKAKKKPAVVSKMNLKLPTAAEKAAVAGRTEGMSLVDNHTVARNHSFSLIEPGTKTGFGFMNPFKAGQEMVAAPWFNRGASMSRVEWLMPMVIGNPDGNIVTKFVLIITEEQFKNKCAAAPNKDDWKPEFLDGENLIILLYYIHFMLSSSLFSPTKLHTYLFVGKLHYKMIVGGQHSAYCMYRVVLDMMESSTDDNGNTVPGMLLEDIEDKYKYVKATVLFGLTADQAMKVAEMHNDNIHSSSYDTKFYDTMLVLRRMVDGQLEEVLNDLTFR
jgi:hypothetical protein